ncbi:MAG: 16S rRNA pseudouridine(516) synthase [Clostridia bacterium]|nr:16S rRNA pseudouridine(516) synthase [Clostridia bacterium]
MKTLRLDRLLAASTELTRSEVHRLLRAGQLCLGGKPVSDPAAPAVWGDAVTVRGESVCTAQHVYYMLNKPAGVVSATEGKDGPTVIDLVPPALRRRGLFPAGRLDKDTVGFCLITDDGDFAHRLLAPRRHVPKTYLATVDGDLDYPAAAAAFEQGLVLGDGTVLLSAALERTSTARTYRVTVHEGRYHQVKRMFAALGVHVVALERIAIGAVPLDPSLKRGELRPLTAEELRLLGQNDE